MSDTSAVKLAYSVDEAGEMIGISRRKLYELLLSGQLASVKIGSRRLVRHADLEAFVAGLDAA
jgi:excisionase family DNA binding protein